MKRTRTWIGGAPLAKSSSIPTAILTADWHIRDTIPICRTDDFFKAMEKKVDFIFSLAKKNKCPILIAGDLGHSPKWSCRLLEWFISKVSGGIKIFVIPGQHDVLNHRVDSWKSCAIGVLHTAEVITLLGPEDLKRDLELDDFWIHAFPYGEPVHDIKLVKSGKPHLAITHQLVLEGKMNKWEEEKGNSAPSLLKEFSSLNIIISGDNHKSFVVEHEGRFLVNPGSVLRMAADQVDHKPRVYLWYGSENRVEPVYLPIEDDVIDRTHIDPQEAKDERIEAYVSRLSEEVEIGLSFEGNLEAYFRTNRVRKPVQDKVWEAMPK